MTGLINSLAVNLDAMLEERREVKLINDGKDGNGMQIGKHKKATLLFSVRFLQKFATESCLLHEILAIFQVINLIRW